MMNSFPTPYEDEVFYGILSRHKLKNGFANQRGFSKDVFGEKLIITSIFFPMHIQKVVDNLPYTSEVTSDEIINKHTLFPLFSAFLSMEKTSDILLAMKEGSKVNIHNTLGLTSSLKLNDYFKYCPRCFKEDMKEKGESYWRRIHQVPGVLFCDRHKCLLRDSNVKFIENSNDYINANEYNCLDNLRKKINDKYYNLNLNFIENVKFLLNNDVNRADLYKIKQFYIEKLKKKDLILKTENIDMKKLQRAFIDYYGSRYLKLIKSDLDVNSSTNWMRLFFRNDNYNKNALRHLLILQFLGVTAKEMFKEMSRMKFQYSIKKSRYESNKKDIIPYPKRERVDWKKRDFETFSKIKRALIEIKAMDGKPIRITKRALRIKIGANKWFNSGKLIETHKYISEIEESIEDFRKRKIRWAIKDMKEKDIKITNCSVRIYAGFGATGQCVKDIIDKEMEHANKICTLQ